MQFVVHHQASCAALVNVYHPLLTPGCWAGLGCSLAQAEEPLQLQPSPLAMKNFIFMMLTFARCQGYQHQHQDKTSVFRQNAPAPSTTLKCPHDAAAELRL